MLNFRVYGKWILVGEHSVLRGGKALVFPLVSRYLDLTFTPGSTFQLEVQHKSTDLEMAFWGGFEKALQLLGLKRDRIKGSLRLESNLPVGAGMGASAVLCVSLVKWLTGLGLLKAEQQYQLATTLENLFHGKSSGVDVAVALKGKALEFSKTQGTETFKAQWSPHLYLSYCGKRGVTSDCVERVQKLIASDPQLGEEIDLKMKKAFLMAKQALLTKAALPLLKESIDLAQDCFQAWGLMGQALQNHILDLKNRGALAAKPTGSGDGGFVLSLWPESPPQDWLDLGPDRASLYGV